MADEKLGKSLDDLIKEQASKSTRKAGAKKGGARGGSEKKKPALAVKKGRGGGVTKVAARPTQRAPLGGRGGGGGGGPPAGGPRGIITVRNPAAAARARAGPPMGGPPPGFGGGPRGGPPMGGPPPAGKWQHDLFNPHQPRTAAVAGSSGAPGGGRVIKNKLFVSNLDDSVTDEDIRELFKECGRIKEAGVHYDRNGKPQGTAHVVFDNAADALAAFQEYNNVALDGKRLNIELVETTVPPGTLVKLSSGINVSKVAPSGGMGGGGGRAGGGGGGFGRNRPRSFVRGRGVPGGGDARME